MRGLRAMPERTLQHYRTILAMPEILGKELKEDALYLDTCRKKRNIAEYDQIGVINVLLNQFYLSRTNSPYYISRASFYLKRI